MSDVKITVGVAGAEEAATAIRKVEVAAGATGQATEKLGHQAWDAGHMLHGLEMAAEGSSRGMFGAGRGAAHLLESLGLGPLGGIALAVGAIGAAFEGLNTMMEKNAQAAKKLQDEMEKLVQDTARLKNERMDSAVEELKKLEQQTERNSSATERLFAATMKLKDAKTQREVAEIDVQEQQALLGLNPGDEIGRKRTRLEYAQKREEHQNAAAVEKAATEADRAAEKLAEGQSAAQAAQNTAAQAAANAATMKAKKKRREEIKAAADKANADLAKAQDADERLQASYGGAHVHVDRETIALAKRLPELQTAAERANQAQKENPLDNEEGAKFQAEVKKRQEEAAAAAIDAAEKQKAIAPLSLAWDTAAEDWRKAKLTQQGSGLKRSDESHAIDAEARRKYEEDEARKQKSADEAHKKQAEEDRHRQEGGLTRALKTTKDEEKALYADPLKQIERNVIPAEYSQYRKNGENPVEFLNRLKEALQKRDAPLLAKIADMERRLELMKEHQDNIVAVVSSNASH